MYFYEIVSLVKKIPKNKDAVIILDNDWDGYQALFYISHTSDKMLVADGEGYQHYIDSSNVRDVMDVKAYKKGFKDKIKKVYDDKTPQDKSKHVGVELEFVSRHSRVELEMIIAGAGLEESVTLKEDGSIDSDDEYEHSHEICILSTEKKIYGIIKKLCAILRDSSSVNSSCGMHVHLDMRSRDVKKSYANLFSYQPLLYSMCPDSRAEGEFSQPVYEYKAFKETDLGMRYVGINKQSYHKHETLEVRIHSGTLNAEKINNWVKLLIKIVDKPIVGTSRVALIRSYKTAKSRIRLTGKLEKYVKSRISDFKEEHGSSDMSIVA